MGSCVEGAIPLAVVGLNHRTNSFVMCGSSALGHGGTSATAMRCWHFAAPSITVPSIGYLNAIDSDFERRKNHRMLLLAPICQLEDIGAFSFYQEGSPVGGGHKAHELRIAKPTIGHDHRWGQRHAASAECRHASIQHGLYPVQFVAARRPRAGGVGTTDGKVHGDHEFAIANDHHQEDPINAREDPVFLPTPPGTDTSQLLPILFEHGVIGDPGPLPPAPRG